MQFVEARSVVPIARANAFLLRGVAMTVKATFDVQRSKELALL